MRKSLQKCNEDRESAKWRQMQGKHEEETNLGCQHQTGMLLLTIFHFFPLILAYLAIILVFSSNPTQTGKAGYIRENCKEILCNPKLADAPKSMACGGYGDLESL